MKTASKLRVMIGAGYSRRISVAVISCFLLRCSVTHGQDAAAVPSPEKLAEMLSKSNQLANPRALGSAFRLTATVAVTDSKGTTVSGAYEETNKSRGTWRRSVTLGDASLTQACADGTFSQQRSEKTIGIEGEMVPHSIFPSLTAIKPGDARWTVEPTQLSNVTLLKLQERLDLRPDIPTPYVAVAYYITPAAGLLRAEVTQNGVTTYNELTREGSLMIPFHITLAMKKDVKTDIHITSYQALQEHAPSDRFQLPGPSQPNAKECDGSGMNLGGAVIEGNLIRPVVGVYPMAAKQARMDGRVVVQVTIGKDGSVKDARATSTTSAIFNDNAIAAVRKARFVPFLLGGEPVEVDGQFTVNFRLGH